MKTQLEKKENTKEEIERKEKDGDERTNQSYLVLPASRSFKKKKSDHRVKSYIYSERASFDIAFWVISELLQLSMELHVNIRK